jgi:hypothetical protein
VLAGVYSYFLVDQRLLKITREPAAEEEAAAEVAADAYQKKYENVKVALPKDIYYSHRRKRLASVMRKRMFSSVVDEDEVLFVIIIIIIILYDYYLSA